MWEAIQSNFTRSRILIIAMGVLLVVLGAVIGLAVDPRQGGQAGAAVALGLWLILWLVALFQGDSILLSSIGAHEIQKQDFPQLWNVVEEMKIAAGLPAMPRVFVIEDNVPNAFAVGRKPQVSAVAVTSGMLSRLNRDELQGVIGHEIGHIHNYDIRFMTIASVLMGAVVLISDVFLRSLWYGAPRRTSSRKGDGGAQAIFIVIAILLAILAPIFAQLLYLACSRRREYLADASSARFTRYPEGLASALEKISVSAGGMTNVNRAVAPLYIINPLQGMSAVGLFSTHPPTEKRIQILRGMAGGAGFVDYDAAYKKVFGKSGVIGGRTLASADSVAIRARSVEPEQKQDVIHRVRQVGDLLGMLGNYALISCECGMRIKVPPGFMRETIQCPRCGRPHRVAEAEDVSGETSAATETAKPPVIPVEGIPETVPPPLPALRYRRRGTGWESFKCSCGGTVQIGPGFQGTHVKCPKCDSSIEVV
ncbi:M48 family metallopeptidase [Candidatus Sumerlaeota bacterium]|nr:M48 family metallopeptidase [Candidatus Sumerlaeota bacterium]MBI3736193.1 M48 family metallopeptidase [Candidatus Sumerlaeota bacterium]